MEVRFDSSGREIKSNKAWREECESLRQQLSQVTAERDELVKALSKYGHHINGCGQGWNCSCGFYAALAKLGAGGTAAEGHNV